MGDGLRKIGASIVLEGENSFKNALKACNAELRNSRSELTLVEAKYKGNENSIEALRAKGDALAKCYADQQNKLETLNNIIAKATQNQENFKNKADAAGKELEEAEQQLEKLKNSSEDTSKEQEELTEKIEKLKAVQKSNTDAYNKATVSLEKYKTQANGVQAEIYDLSNAMEDNTQQTQSWGDKTANATNALATAIAASGVKKGIEEITEAITDCTKAAIEYESAFAGVKKTVDGSDEQLQAISEGILSMSYRLPSTAVEIANVAESAGQLGIARENVLDFSETMIGLGEATNLSSDEAASSLAKFANITKMSANDYSRLGSVIVDLGNNYATTESDIVSMATRLASSGSLAGFTQPQILALATALSSVGIEAEAGGSAMSKLLTNISLAVETSSDDLKSFANVAGMSAEEFAKAWRNNAAGAFTTFIAGLNDTDRLGKSVAATLSDLGIKEIRLSNATRSLANYSDGLTSAMQTADAAWTENVALQNEVSKRYETTESKMQMVKNAANGLKIAIGNALTPAINKLAGEASGILQKAADFVADNPQVVRGVIAITAGIATMTTIVTAATLAVQLYNAVMAVASGGTTLLIGAAAALVVTLGTLVIANSDAASATAELNTATKDAADTIKDADETYSDTIATLSATSGMAQKYIDRLAELEKQGINTKEAQDEYNRLVKQLQALMPELNIELDEQTGLIKGGTAALKSQTDAWYENAKAQALQTALQEKYDAIAEALGSVTKAEIELSDQRNKADALLVEQNNLYKQLAERLGITIVQAKNLTAEQLQQANGSCPDLMDAIYQNKVAYEGLTSSIADNEQTIVENKETITAMEGEIDNTVDVFNELVDTVDGVTDSQNNLNDSMADAQAAAETQNVALQELYDATYTSAKESIEGQVDLFHKFDEESATLTSDEVKENLSSNAESLNEFAAAYQEAATKGYDPNFLRQFQDFSPDNLQVLNDLISKTPDEVDEFNKAWEKFETSKNNYADTLGQVEQEFAKTKTEVEKTANEMAKALDKKEQTAISGNNFCNGFLDVLAKRKPEFYNMGAELGNSAKKGFDSVKGIDAHSPSHKSAQSADYFADGFILQMQKRQKDFEDATTEAAQLVTANMYSWQPKTYTAPQPAPQIDTEMITDAVRRGMQDANVTVDFDYRGFDKGRDKYDR